MVCRKIEATVLVENDAATGFEPEFGLAIWIEVDGLKLLFDTGQAGALFSNARNAGINLAEAAYIALSHGHFDHTGGLARALAIASKAQLILHPQALIERYSLHRGEPLHSVGMPSDAIKAVESMVEDRLLWSRQPVWLTPDIGITGEIPRATIFEDVGGSFFCDRAGRCPDALLDDQALWINTGEGLVIFVGCSHAGIINTVSYVQKLTEVDRVKALIGGFHLINSSFERRRATFEALKNLGSQCLIPCHCTGKNVIQEMRTLLGEEVVRDVAARRFRLGDGQHA
jgi:7,8-dihydropterin-6-yl-methyl-4-(beta-D-ribofuranosyl)aminobenzene 5'-phosphate synthase